MLRDEFSWVKTHSELTEFLSSKENSQIDLVGILKAVGIGPLNDKAGNGDHDIELNEIDPFTFFCYIYKFGPERRLSYLQKIANLLGITVPKGESGIPSTQPQKVWMFSYKYKRKENDIKILWSFFRKVISNEVEEIDFQEVLGVRNTGKTKLTEVLFYVNPEKYLPINGPTKPYIQEVLGLNPHFSTFAEYLLLLESIKAKSTLPFFELSYKAWKWNTEERRVKYWIFQANPNIFDIETALREEILSNWTVSAHRDEIKIGDKVILWITGKEAGCYALAVVASEPYRKENSSDEHLWKGKDGSIFKADITITHNFVDRPILDNMILNVTELKNIKVGNQGTNFSASKEEYEAILKLSKDRLGRSYWLYAPGENAKKWDEFYDKKIMALGWDDIGNLAQYKSRDQIKSALISSYGGDGSKKNDVSANDDFLNKVKVGDFVIAKKGRRELLGYGIVMSEYQFDQGRNEYKHIRKVDWKIKGNWALDFSLVLKTLTDITSYSSTNPSYRYYYEMLLGLMEEKNMAINNRDAFIRWLSKEYGENSGTVSSYVKAIEILSKNLKQELFYSDDLSFLQSLYKDLIKDQRNQTSRYYYSEAPSYGNNGFYSASIKSYIEFLLSRNQINSLNIEVMKFPLNTIFYGPPGTGKTFTTVLRAAEIISKRKIDSYGEALKIFNSSLHDQIEYITFHQSYSYEDFIQGLRPDTENERELTFIWKNGIFKHISDKAYKNMIEAEGAVKIKKTFDQVFSQYFSQLIEGEIAEIEVKMKNVSYYITAITDKSIEFRKASGGTEHTLSISTLRKMYDSESTLEMQGLSPYYTPLLSSLLKIGKELNGEIGSIEQKNYVLVIDEINRANISKVFGELITLIEPDKRSHGLMPIRVKLPSGEDFVVPSNLFILGTMNTADKSLSLLDIALRRRFEFESMYPKYQIDGGLIHHPEILRRINEKIIKAKGYDFQVGHAYFMGAKFDLIDCVNKKITPLLLEYFMNDDKEVKDILSYAGFIVEENSWPLSVIKKND